MFDNKVIVEDSLRNLADNHAFEGFEVNARLPYYRGLGLSMVEDIAVTVDGEDVARENVRFCVRGKTWSLDEMETEYGDRWNFGESAAVQVMRKGGLSKGEHRISVAVRMRVSYLPFVPTTKDTKALVLKS